MLFKAISILHYLAKTLAYSHAHIRVGRNFCQAKRLLFNFFFLLHYVCMCCVISSKKVEGILCAFQLLSAIIKNYYLLKCLSSLNEWKIFFCFFILMKTNYIFSKYSKETLKDSVLKLKLSTTFGDSCVLF